MIIIAFLTSFTYYKIMNVAGSKQMLFCPLNGISYTTTHQDDKVANKCVHSLVSGFSHKSDHTSGEPAKDQTEAPQLYHRNTGTGSEPSSGCTQFCTWG